jgi:hypothetical protein
MAWVVFRLFPAILKPFLPLVHLSLHNSPLHIVPTFYCESQRVLPPQTTNIEWQHVAQQWYNQKEEPTYLHNDYMSFTDYNGYLITSLDIAQHVVGLMSARTELTYYQDFTHNLHLLFKFPL